MSIESAVAEAYDDRPTVIIDGGDIDRVADEAEQNLLAAGRLIFQYGDQLVTIGPRIFDIANGKKGRGLRILPLVPSNLVDFCTATSNFRKPLRSNPKVSRPVDFPDRVANLLLERKPEQWRAPRLKGLATSPVLVADGRILDCEGYDARSGIYVDFQGVTFPPITVQPSRDEAQAALAMLEDLLKDFPFAALTDRDIAIAQTLTLLARGYFPHAPIFAGDATAAGSGKTLLQNISAIIATGEEAEVCEMPGEPEEARKVLDSLLIEGAGIILFDNIEVALRGAKLCQAATQSPVKVRVLSQSRTVTVDTESTTFLANGNNLIVDGDVSRRAIRWRLEPAMEQPELRDLDEEATRARVKRERPQLVAAGLTILRYYIVQGQPDPVPAIGNFDQWKRLIPSALHHLTGRDPCASMRAVREEDPKRTTLLSLLTAWRAEFKDRLVTTREAAERADLKMNDGKPVTPNFRDALLAVAKLEKNGNVSGQSLAYYLRQQKGRIVGEMKFQSQEDTHTKSMRWGVSVTPGKVVAGDSG